MQFLKIVAIAVIYFQGVISAPASIEDLDAECGALGVMKIDKDTLPPGVNPDNVRKCLNHPESLVREKGDKKIFERQCWKGGEYGCSHNGYCWRQCGPSGRWCWAAEEQGFSLLELARLQCHHALWSRQLR
ncbi:IDI-2 precursor [Metarhizium robertsii ARSEF 23]|uniref:IDI-2 n=1 Tax=Metarhizium robertsii (strain ARSEF 23 / ATCC MYA-3075) TaxID=655844 RepID=E9F956_METRA|nr:IDI-2 precursor [Metarhizium robertsii ARSEF 23]EFY95661.2 IDI-2 precursor [Metarhizium robertsii ARSEF 23]